MGRTRRDGRLPLVLLLVASLLAACGAAAEVEPVATSGPGGDADPASGVTTAEADDRGDDQAAADAPDTDDAPSGDNGPSPAVETAPGRDEEPGTDTGPEGATSTSAAREPTISLPPPPRADPVRVRLPRLGVDAPIDAVGLEPDGAMEIPHDVRRVGWFEPGVAPGGHRGTAVLSGHVDDRVQGRGALWALRTMQPGDEIAVEHEDGSTSHWRVDRTTSYPKPELPIPAIFTGRGDPRLVLITCGGAFDASRRSYLDNIVVYASPAVDAGGQEAATG